MKNFMYKLIVSKRIASTVLLLLPFWLPPVYLALMALEAQFTEHGLFQALSLVALWATPAVGYLPIMLSENETLLGKILLAPIYYFFGLFISGVMGWIIGCQFGLVGCY